MLWKRCKEVNKIEIEYDKDLKENTKTTIEGTIKENNGSYSIEVDDIDKIYKSLDYISQKNYLKELPKVNDE